MFDENDLNGFEHTDYHEPAPQEPIDYTAPREPVYTAPQETRKTQKRDRRGMSTGGVVALCLACALVAGAAGSAGTYVATKNHTAVGQTLDSLAPASVPVISTVSYEGASNEAAAQIYELATKQVVGISTTIDYGYSIFGQVASSQVAGSGFIISEDGYIVTNYHVVEQAYQRGTPVTVMMHDETTYEAEIVGFDADNDIALLKIDAEGLIPAQLGNSDVTVGQTVYAVGNALGYLNYTMTSGIVSATDRTISTDVSRAVNVMQIDAAINNGNSGGPVYNTAGQVIGVVDAKSGNSSAEGLGFAIPISDVAHIVNQILEHGYVADKAFLGITCSTVTESAAKSYDLTVGAYINNVVEGSPAEQIGLQEGDIVTALDGEPITSSSQLTALIKQHRAGDEAELTIIRGDEELTMTVTFGERPPEEEAEEEKDERSGDAPSSEPGDGYYYYSGNGDIEDFFRQFFGFGF